MFYVLHFGEGQQGPVRKCGGTCRENMHDAFTRTVALIGVLQLGHDCIPAAPEGHGELFRSNIGMQRARL